MFAISILLLSLLSPQETPARSTSKDAFEAGAISELFIGRPPGAQVLYFRLDRGAWNEDKRGESPLGVARWMRSRGEGFGESRSELEVYFFEDRTRLSHVEQILPGERLLVWREFRAQGGRSLHLKGASSTGFQLTDTSKGGTRRASVGGERGLLPLELVEAVGRGQVYMGSFPIFQPLSGAFESLQLRTKKGLDENGYRIRDLFVTEQNGTVRASYRFRRGEVFEFGWREDGPRARRITPEEHGRWVRTLGPRSRAKESNEKPSETRTPELEGPNPGRTGGGGGR